MLSTYIADSAVDYLFDNVPLEIKVVQTQIDTSGNLSTEWVILPWRSMDRIFTEEEISECLTWNVLDAEMGPSVQRSKKDWLILGSSSAMSWLSGSAGAKEGTTSDPRFYLVSTF